VVRERLGVPVVSDFRPADMAAGGQGAPLVPMLDYCLFASKTKNRVLLNLGGIANMTVIPAGAGIEDVIAFDTGPGNMVIDAVMQREFGKAFDRGGKFGMLGLMLEPVLMELIEERYFELPPPKSCGREQFGAAFVERFSKMCAANGGDARDMVATAVALTATTVSAAYQHFCRERMQGGVTEMIVAGGGVRNEGLMEALREMLRWMNVKVMATDEVGLAAQAKEAVAFALLGWLSWHGLPGNVPSATGAKRAVVLGKVTG
jgi:anhydro-N-acetylmuramic acid kinase